MGSHDPFGHLKHKLWPKEGSGVKLAISLSTTKSWESPRFPCMQVSCHILLESFRWGLQLFFRPHFNRRFIHKVMGPQLWGFRDSHLGVLGQNDIWVLVLWPGIEYTIRGKVVASPKFGPWWIMWVRVCSWLVRAPKGSNYALTNLLFGLCRSVWVSDLLVNLPSPILELQHAPLTLKCWPREHTPTLSLSVIFFFGLVAELIKELGGASTRLIVFMHCICNFVFCKMIICFGTLFECCVECWWCFCLWNCNRYEL